MRVGWGPGMKMALHILDRGHRRGLFELRDVFLVEGEVGKSTWLEKLGVIAGHADEIAEWAESMGIKVKRFNQQNEEQ